HGLPKTMKKKGDESTVDWIGRSLLANNVVFSEQEWFASANCLRNLIAHNGTRAGDSRVKRSVERSRTAFPNIETFQDGYVCIDHEHVAELQIKIEDFIRETANATLIGQAGQSDRT
ncbi:hypothetical protein LCGC14_3059980, partial [marine sediment metagenome]